MKALVILFDISALCEFPNRIGDGFCDLSNYVSQSISCNFDGGDCDQCNPELQNDGKCQAINIVNNCYLSDKDCENLPENCTAKIGNGICDLETNTEECHFDGGECCDGRLQMDSISKMEQCLSEGTHIDFQ